MIKLALNPARMISARLLVLLTCIPFFLATLSTTKGMAEPTPPDAGDRIFQLDPAMPAEAMEDCAGACYTLAGGLAASVHQNFKICGATQASIDARIADCATKNGSNASWDGRTTTPARGIWKLVTVLAPVNGSGACGSYPYTGTPGSVCFYREVWRDEQTKFLWTSKISKGDNWCRVAADISAINPICSNATYQPQVASKIAQSYCREFSKDSLLAPVPASAANWNMNERWAEGLYADAKGGMGLKTVPTVTWMGPSMNDFDTALRNGLAMVMPDMGDFGYSNYGWSNESFSQVDAGACYIQESGSSFMCSRYRVQDQAFSVRCRGRVDVDHTEPKVSLDSPVSGAVLTGKVTVTATATDNVGVQSVDLLIDGRITEVTSLKPYRFTWDTTKTSNGVHQVAVAAYDAEYNLVSSAPAIVTVQNPDATPPQVAISSPASGASVNAVVTVQVTASDNGRIARVEVYADNRLLGSTTTSPYQLNWDTTTLANGPHSLSAKAYDEVGNAATSAVVPVNVQNGDSTPPQVAFSFPQPGTSLSGTITASLNASDNVQVTKLELYAGGRLVGSTANAPYTIPWDTTTVANGSYELLAKAYDAAGNIGQSSPVAVTVQNRDQVPPTVAFIAPSNNATVADGLAISVNASDNKAVTKVEFYVDANLVGTVSTAPYQLLWNTSSVANGVHTLSAKAYDADANVGSSSLSINVQNRDKTPPTVTLTAPTNGSTVIGKVALTASARDNIKVTKVEFYVAGQLVGSASTEPFAVTWDSTSVANASQQIIAKAYDAEGNVGTSTTVSVTVRNPQLKVFARSDKPSYERGPTNLPTSLLVSTSLDETPQGGVAFTAVLTYPNGQVVNLASTTDATGQRAFGAQVVPNSALGVYTFSATATYNGMSATHSSTFTITKDLVLPLATITAPAAGATLAGTVTANVTATDNVKLVSVALYANGQLISSQSSSPAAFTWDTTTVADGVYTLVAKATDHENNVGSSTPVNVTIANRDTVAPTVSITSPSAGAKLSGQTTVSMAASDNKDVARVELYIGSQLVGTTSTSPYQITWDTATVANGSYTLVAKAFDSAGNTGTSAAVTVTAYNPMLRVEVRSDRTVYDRQATQYNAQLYTATFMDATALPNIAIAATLTWPNGTKQSINTTTNAAGQRTFYQDIQMNSQVGVYTFSVVATYNGKSASASTTFTVR